MAVNQYGTPVYYWQDGTEITEWQLEQRFDEWLDETSEPVVIFGRYEYAVSRVLKAIDSVMYREAYLEYVDGLISEGELFEDMPVDE